MNVVLRISVIILTVTVVNFTAMTHGFVFTIQDCPTADGGQLVVKIAERSFFFFLFNQFSACVIPTTFNSLNGPQQQ